MVPVDATDGATIAVASVIHQDIDLELGEVPDLEGYHQIEGVFDVKLGDELPEDQQRVRRYPHVFTDMPGETDMIQRQIKLTDDMPIRCKPYPLPYAMRGVEERSGYYAEDRSEETVNISVCIAHCHGEQE